MIDKTTTLAEAIAAIPDGATVALGGNTLHRAPCASVHEIVRQGKRGLNLVKTAGAYDVDLLCAAGCADAVSAGFVGYETPFGMAPAFRRAVETGAVEALKCCFRSPSFVTTSSNRSRYSRPGSKRSTVRRSFS